MAQILSGRIQYPHADGVIFGPGCAREQLHELLDGLGSERPFLLTTPSLTRTVLLPEVRDAIGPHLAGEFTESREHTPQEVVLQATRMAREVQADALISFGGSSVVDLTKGVALVLAEGEDLSRVRVHFAPDTGLQLPDLPAPKVPHIALPTTLSGAEFTGAIGITDTNRGEKVLYLDAKLTPRWVVLDPELARATPASLWAATGMKIFADGLEALCSTRATPYTDALAQSALSLLYQELPGAVADANDVAARGRCLFAAFMLLPNLLNVGLGVVAGLRHQIGGGFGVPHGVASTIVLPHVLRWNLPAATPPLAQTARSLGVEVSTDEEAAALNTISAVDQLIKELALPQRLRDVDVPQDALPSIAEHTAHDFVVATNPRPVRNSSELLEVLQAAW
ncbi:iron-containing alcohol dehydrogenase [Candidatus Entotheonella palauensis]|uniref:iron-containing alcohol dehydrogenase n=1 Tax=Candidatus Entotheonella palauensis TaxID=93172 RepID=UPI0015C4C4CA|nr:iron-containing alcohol dehydrogenase [Candidatus Entotheonella palauensis]